LPRPDGRQNDQLRPLRITRGFTDVPAGSVLVETGRTRVLCAVSIENTVPIWRRGRGLGWLTAEYAMLPGSTAPRKQRESTRGKRDGRSVEIGRLIGRALRSIIHFDTLGENTLHVDCDVLVADGGTRTAAITGAYVALADAAAQLLRDEVVEESPLKCQVAATSVGLIDGEVRLDLPYVEDAAAEVDMNVVMTSKGEFVEVQGSAENGTFNRAQHDALLDVAHKGCEEIFALQRATLAAPLPLREGQG
jgi:ribonuclease PH